MGAVVGLDQLGLNLLVHSQIWWPLHQHNLIVLCQKASGDVSTATFSVGQLAAGALPWISLSSCALCGNHPVESGFAQFITATGCFCVYEKLLPTDLLHNHKQFRLLWLLLKNVQLYCIKLQLPVVVWNKTLHCVSLNCVGSQDSFHGSWLSGTWKSKHARTL